MKTLLLSTITVLFLATGTAHAVCADDDDACAYKAEHPRGDAPAMDACAEGNQEACALVQEHRRQDRQKWVWRCSFPHTPNDEQLEEHGRCCVRWPNVPFCNGDYARAMSLPRCAKLPHSANIKCAERVLERKKR
jgi:hypothetical protein